MPANARGQNGQADATRWLPLVLLVLAALAAVVLVALRPAGDEPRSADVPQTSPTSVSTRSRVSAPQRPPLASRPSVADTGPWDAAAPEPQRLERIAALAEGTAEDAQAELIAAARLDPSPDVRAAALEALEADDSLAALSAFVHALSDPDDWVREAGAMGIYRFPGREHATGALAGMCRTDDRELRIRAAELLDEMVELQLPWDEIDGGPVVLAWAPPDPFEEGR
jgi:hypothetical protein